jgi:hypothetical protein
MSIGIQISSVNYNGQSGVVTFYPYTGGSINIGVQTIPFTYESDYPYGTYEMQFTAYTSTCETIFPLPTPTNNILWKATGKVCEGRPMVERVRMYEKKGGGWRMGKATDEQVYNNLKEFYTNEIAPRKEAKALIVKRRMGEAKITEMTDEVGEQDGVDHEVSMARASLINIAKACQDLMGKIGSQEKDLPGWIQDHITNSENYIMQASKGYHEIDDQFKGNTITGPTQLDQNGK